MSYIEKKTINGKTYIYFVKKISFMNKLFIIKKSMGINSSTINKEKYLLDNLESLSKEEFDFRRKFLKEIKGGISHHKNLPERIEIKSININNILEGKKCLQILETEFAKEFIFNSNNIEGSKIPPERVREIIDAGDTKYKDRNEVKEVKNSIIAFEYLKKSFKFNLSSIKRLYYILTKDLVREGNQSYPRGFKKEPNVVGNSTTASPEKVEEELKNLIKWYKKNKNKLHPFVLAFEFHRKYEFIHPFLDGNGRTGRLIMNKILLNSGYFPVIVYKSNKQSYFNAMEKSKEGKLKNYYQFMLEQADKSYNYLLEILKKY
ncbi:Fic family protein [Candidatus Pacearchaeota archaeon]|nr:Fic family protein [Candidatus Pacearchaeota archaeon]MBI2056880.1 Fic family protein [Candidatus Pacearchaeota archaeon]